MAQSDHAPDVLSIEDIYLAHHQQVRAICLRLTKDSHDAEDLLQETFIKAMRGLDRYEPENMMGWLHRIAKNAFLDQMRKKSRISMLSFENSEQSAGENSTASMEWLGHKLGRSFSSAEQSWHDDRVPEDLQQMLEQMPENFREPLVMAALEDLPYDQIASELQIPVGTVRSRIHRAKRMLRRELETVAS